MPRRTGTCRPWVALGELRQDLLFRLSAYTVSLPPLRERLEDVKELVYHHFERLSNRYGVAVKGVSPDFVETLGAHPLAGKHPGTREHPR